MTIEHFQVENIYWKKNGRDDVFFFWGAKENTNGEKKRQNGVGGGNEINSKMKIEGGYGYTMVWQTERCS